MDIGVVGVGFALALLGTLFGFALNGLYQWWLNKEAGEKRRKLIRVILRLEIDGNFTSLENFWKEAREHGFKVKDGEVIAGTTKDGRVEFGIDSEMPFPEWQFHAIESNMSELPDVLSESEIKQLFNLRNDFENLTAIYAKLFSVLQKLEELQLQPYTVDQQKNVLKGHRHNILLRRRNRIIQEVYEISQGLIERGNPLAKK